MNYVGIDPGRKATGYAVVGPGCRPSAFWERGCDRPELARTLETFCRGMTPVKVTIEKAHLRGGGLGAKTARGAVENRALAEYLAGWLTRAGFDVLLVSPSRWKRNLPKGVVHARVARDFPEVYNSVQGIGKPDALDAFALAYWRMTRCGD